MKTNGDDNANQYQDFLPNNTCREQGAPSHFPSAMTPMHKVMK